VENAFLVGLSQQMASTRAMEVIANNLSNVSTPAFKHEEVAFEQYMVPVQATETEGGGTINVSFVLDRGVVRDLSAGRMEQTDSPLDMAIDGPGYFVVQTPDGERYTRNGHFRFDGQGQVVTENGYVLQSDGGAITLQPQDGDLRIGPDGSISTDLQAVGKLRIVNFANQLALQKMGTSLYDAAGQQPTPVTSPHVHQGMIEKSNVEPVVEITHMIEVMRAYQACVELTQSGEDLLKQAIDKIGTVPQA
jgi:flagellar basal-body rod protein FlgF